jgi:hypothetical protein
MSMLRTMTRDEADRLAGSIYRRAVGYDLTGTSLTVYESEYAVEAVSCSYS